MKKNHEHTDIEISKLCVLPQVRKTKNARIKELIDSIRDKGLINPLNVARLNPQEFSKYLNFVNSI